MQSKILEKFNNSFERVYFNAGNPMHLVCANGIIFHQKQHPILRFHLEDGYESVPQMMLFKIAQKNLQGDIDVQNV